LIIYAIHTQFSWKIMAGNAALN